MSKISEIYKGYSQALMISQSSYAALYRERARNAAEFYENFLHRLVRSFAQFREPGGNRQVKQLLEDFFNTSEVEFVAIDGSCAKDGFNDFIVFFAAAYGVKGVVSFEGNPPQTRYKRWSMDQDVSLVAYVPVPFAEIADVAEGRVDEEQFAVSDTDKINLSNIHLPLMQLAEIYLAYDVAKSSTSTKVHLILLDHSPSSILASTEVGVEAIKLLGHYRHYGRAIQKADARIAYAHPFNDRLQLPPRKKFRYYNHLLYRLSTEGGRIPLDIETQQGSGRLEQDSITQVKGNWLVLNPEWYDSWEYTKGLFETLCRRLFVHKDFGALKYEVITQDGGRRWRWLAPEDVRFLIAVGLRALVEECWKQRIMLVGIVKDSSSQYFSRNYLGVLRHPDVAYYPAVQTQPLPWTDRALFELLPLFDKNPGQTLYAPWASTEFDSIFMTLQAYHDNETEEVRVQGVQGGKILSPERIFLRALAQFYLSRDKSSPTMGHAIFVDRLAFPELDGRNWGNNLLKVETQDLGALYPIVFGDSTVNNVGQVMVMRLLDVLTRNLFPEVIGYPDPLHKADWGAKSVMRNVREMIRSSEASFRANPIARTLRQVREEYKR
jgi:hypothetical protein